MQYRTTSPQLCACPFFALSRYRVQLRSEEKSILHRSQQFYYLNGTGTRKAKLKQSEDLQCGDAVSNYIAAALRLPFFRPLAVPCTALERRKWHPAPFSTVLLFKRHRNVQMRGPRAKGQRAKGPSDNSV